LFSKSCDQFSLFLKEYEEAEFESAPTFNYSDFNFGNYYMAVQD